MSGVTTADSAARADWIDCEPNARTNTVPRTRKVDIATPFRLILRKNKGCVSWSPIHRLADEGSGCCPWATEPFVQTDAAEARLAQRHERVLFDPAAVVSGLGVAHDLTRVADRFQIAGDNFVEGRSVRAGDLDDAVSRRRERHIGNDGGNVVRRDRLEQAGRNPDFVSIRT